MRTYKLFRIKGGRLYPLFVQTNREMKPGVWLDAEVGELADENHVRSRIGPLSRRPGFHSTGSEGRGLTDNSISPRTPSGVYAKSRVSR